MDNMSQNENILLIRLKSIGDILFTLPAVHIVAKIFRTRNFTFLFPKNTRHCCADFLKLMKSSRSTARFIAPGI